MKRIHVAALLFVAGIVFWGCKKEENLPIEPVVEFKDFKILGNDSAQITITFQDGDGDIGLAQGDTFAPHNPGNKYYHNFFMRYYYKDSAGVYHPYLAYLNADTILDTLDFNYRVPYLTQQDQKESLTGDIIVTLYPFTLYHIPGHGTFKYEVSIVDRELHLSNKVETDDINP